MTNAPTPPASRHLSSGSLRAVLATLLLALACLLGLVSAQAQTSFTGSYSQNFDGMGTGTAAPAGWTAHGSLGGDKDTWDASTGLPANGTVSAATNGTVNATLIVNSNVAAITGSGSNSQGYNFALSGSTSDRALGSSPTSGAGIILQLRLTNDTGEPVKRLNVSYDIRRFTAVSTNEEFPGYWLYVSTDNGATWSNVSQFNTTVSGGPVNVPGSTGVTNVGPGTLVLPEAVPAGGEIRFRWVDDNGPPSPDQRYGLDNVAILSAAPAPAPDFDGSYTENFDGMEEGTAAPLGWTVHGLLGGGITTWTDATGIPASGIVSAATAGTVNPTLIVRSNLPAAPGTSNTQGYNLALSDSTTNRALGSSPTSGAGIILQLRLNNATGEPVDKIRLSYDIRRFTSVSTAENLPGYRLFVSSDEGLTWSAVSQFDPTLDGGDWNVPSSAGVTSVGPRAVTLPSAVAAGDPILFRWVDDNGPPSPDQIIGLDNVVVLSPQPAPTVTLTAPSEGAAFDLPAPVALSADAADSNGTVERVEFFANGVKVGEAAAAPFDFSWSGMASGSYALVARATDNDGDFTDSDPVNITVANPNNQPPSVTLVSPANGGLVAGDTALLSATASDTDGFIAKVEFYEGSNKIGEATAAPFQFTWSNVATGTYTLRARAIDNDGGASDSAPATVTFVVPVEETLITRRPAGQPGSVWKYLDDGSDQGTAWREPGFDDSSWASGPAPLGYGDSHIVTTVNSGPSGNRIIATWLRREFTLVGAAKVQAIKLNVLRDDGVVVYINGVEVARQNMPEGPITHLTNASSIVDGASETTYFPSEVIDLPPLNEGPNLIAVQLHNRDGNSSDLGFDLELITLSLPGTPPSVELTGPADGADFTAPATINLTAEASDDDGTVAKVEFFANGEKIGEATEEPYAYQWTMVPQGDYNLTARATDNYGLVATSDPVGITVGPPNTIFPTVTITSPSEADAFLDPATIAIAADAADADGTVVKVEFFADGIKLGEDTAAPYSFTWIDVPAGTYVLTARATDNLTAATLSAPVSVTVAPNLPPSVTLLTPLDAATGLGGAGRVNLSAEVSDPEGMPLSVTFYGRPKGPVAGEDFTLVTLPDTQFYSQNSGGNRFQHFLSQTNWIVASKDLLNTQFVAHMGDMTQEYNNVEAEFIRADEAMSIIENPLTTLLTHGIPWGGAPGNHDIGSGGNTSLWNQYFGISRWAGRPYFGGGYTNNTSDQNWQTFSAGGMDFLVVNLAYNSSTSGNTAVLNWADALLKAHPNHRAIVTSHWMIGTSFPPAQSNWGGHGQAVYNKLRENPNLFLMLCGHIHGEGRRLDVYEGRTVHTVLQDYQSRANGGDSWLRYFTFRPSQNKIDAYTYKTNTAPAGNPLGGTYETDADSQFSLDYDMSTEAEWTALGTVSLGAGESLATLPWTGLSIGEEYEWYAAVSDGVTPVGSTPRSFTTGGNAAPSITLTAPADESTVTRPATVDFAATASDLDGDIARVEFYQGAMKIGEDETAPYAFSWEAPAGVHSVSARAIDNEGAETDSASATVTVKFAIEPSLTGGSEGGSVSGGGDYLPGSTATFVATPNAGYTFVGWIVDGAPAGADPTLEIVVTEGMSVEAEFAKLPYTLQLLHLADGEAGLLASQTAPFLAAMVEGFEGAYDNTLILSGGDNFLPGPFLNAGTDPALNAVASVGRTAPARPDIAIHNVIGVEASAIGNHEWDLGSATFIDAIRPDNQWTGALFPHISSNLDYSQDAAALGRFTDVPLDGAATPVPEASALNSRLAPVAVITKGGERIGLVGATTQLLRTISSPSGTFAKGFPPGAAGADDMDLLATHLQPYIDELTAEGVNKIVLLSHLQQIANEQLLATKLSGVDVILAAGSNTRLGDDDDVAVAFPGHAADFAGPYPIVTAGSDGKPVLVVCTDNEYTYLGRLVVDFDENGEILLGSLPGRVPVNGAYASTAANAAAAWGVDEADLATTAFAPGTKGAGVKEIVDAVQGVIDAKDGDVKGFTSVYLEGERNFVRSEETNLGNITADANALAYLAAAPGDDTPVVSLKNGGGIRAQIGSVEVGSGAKQPPLANPGAGKPAGGVSVLDIENALRFNNRLMVLDTTPQGLKAILEHGVAAGVLQGRFPQVGGVSFAWDPARDPGDRIVSLSLVGEAGQLLEAIYRQGEGFSPWAPATIRLVTLNFLANGGDGFPVKANGSNFRYLLDGGGLSAPVDPSENFTATPALPGDAMGEQRAFFDYLGARHGTAGTAYAAADTPASGDLRIQNLSARGDAVPFDLTLLLGGDGTGGISASLQPDQRQGFRFSLGGRRLVSIAGSGATGLTAELLATDGTVVASHDGAGPFLLEGLLDPGDYLLRAVNPGGGAQALSLNVDAGTVPFVRPDAAAGRSLGAQVGVGAYGPPSRQQASLVSLRLRPVRAVATVRNNGNVPDAMRVRAGRGNANFAVAYRVGAANATAALLSGSFATPALSVGQAPVAVNATVTPNRKRLTARRGRRTSVRRASFVTQVRATSQSSPVVSDAAAIRVLTR